MQTIYPLALEDFNKDSILVISKVEIDSNGEGNFQELPDVKNYTISTNEENRVAKFCSYSFNLTCLNTGNRYGILNSGSPYYEWMKQGRKIKLFAGIKKNETNYPYQLILGRIDDFKLNKKSGEEICTVTGRCLMRMVLDFKLYFPNTYWGTDHTYNTIANKIRYDLETDCKGIYRVFLDSTPPYDGSNLEEIYENTDWSYDWHNNQLIFTPRRIPDFAGTNNLKVYYFQTQDVEDVVADVLLAAGIFADETERNAWLVNEYCTETGKTIDRVWFDTGTSALKAITLLSEIVQYRFYFDYAGNPIFRSEPSAGPLVNTISDYEAKIEDIEENVEEVYTHIIVIGEERDRIIGEDEIAPDISTGLTLSTGLGLPTQASLAWIKAEWNANTEGDFGHYELRIRKTAYSYFTEVSTIAISFIWYGLEPGVEYGVQIRAVDIYNNRSNWSTEKIILTATDMNIPAQITGAVASALLAGIKVTWSGATEGDIAGYIIERQESENGTTWIGAWIERARINASMWLDLLLTYSTYYRYRIKAYTQAGVEGISSTPTADSIKPNQAGSNDIIFKSITGDHIAVNKLDVISADMGTITAGTITLNTTGFIRSVDKTYGSALAGFWMGYTSGAYKLHIGTLDKYLMWDGVSLDIKGNLIITGGSGIANLTDAGDLALLDSVTYAAITGAKPPINADYFGGVAGALAYYNLVSLAVLDSTIIVGGFIKTSLLTANNIRVGELQAIRFRCGGGTNEDIYFEDSGIRLYDAGSNILNFYKSGLALVSMYFSNGVRLYTSGDFVSLHAGSYIFSCNNSGCFKFPSVVSAPAGAQGYMTYNDANDRFVGFIGGSDNKWGHWLLSSGW